MQLLCNGMECIQHITYTCLQGIPFNASVSLHVKLCTVDLSHIILAIKVRVLAYFVSFPLGITPVTIVL